ncbi:MAG: polynucleotide adenylyltransferase PcnB [Pseudohongiellaceae bacterium]
MLKRLSKALAGRRRPKPQNDEVVRPAGQSGNIDLLMSQLKSNGVKVIEREDHPISRQQISPGAVKILYQLGDGGFQGYLVGGSVRDLLIGNQPKDFDIATDATPEDLRRLFRNARIIGKRFKIVHIRMGREIIEVTTFRAHHTVQNEFAGRDDSKRFRDLDSAHSSGGMLLRDNVFGDIYDDAVRRDFTVNALYYTVKGFRVLDFSSGIEDIRKKLIRIIGDPVTRYKEDPVRMLRAIRFAARLDFSIEPATAKPINDLAYLLESVSPARLFDEVLKLLSAGYGEKTLHVLQQFQLGDYLFPATMKCLRQGDTVENRLLSLALRNTDTRLADGKSVTPAFLFAALLWPVLRTRLQDRFGNEVYSLQDFLHSANDVIEDQLVYTAVPRRFTTMAREIWELQVRLVRRTPRSVSGAFAHPRFRAGYDFLLLREDAGENLDDLGQWWTDFQFADASQQAAMLGGLSHSREGKPGKRRPRKRSTNTKTNGSHG